MSATMKTTAIAPWYGSKRTLAPRIIELLGPHTMYYEPFCGSMAVLLAKPTSRYETVCDLHGDLINLARVLADLESASQLHARLQSTLFSEELFLRCRQLLRSNPADASPVDRAWAYFIFSWAGRSGVSGIARDSFQITVRWTPTSSSPTALFRSAIDSIPAWHERLRNVVILQRSAWEVIPSILDEEGICIYCDPPYLVKSAKYKHDFDGIDHHKLAGLLNRFERARVVVSYYADKWLHDLYPAEKWEHIDATMTKNLATQNKRGATRGVAPEVLIVSRREVTA